MTTVCPCGNIPGLWVACTSTGTPELSLKMGSSHVTLPWSPGEITCSGEKHLSTRGGVSSARYPRFRSLVSVHLKNWEVLLSKLRLFPKFSSDKYVESIISLTIVDHETSSQ